MAAKSLTIDQYLAGIGADKRAALQRLRKVIRAAAPGAEERISYGIVGFRLAGKWLVWIGAGANHCAIYGVVASKNELEGYDTTGRGTIRFKPDEPLPATLVRKWVKAKIAKSASSKSRSL